MVITWPQFLQWPRLPAMRASSSNRAPQLWQKNTMGMVFPLHAGRVGALLRSAKLGHFVRPASDKSKKRFHPRELAPEVHFFSAGGVKRKRATVREEVAGSPAARSQTVTARPRSRQTLAGRWRRDR